jgi:hypothetical protein
VKRKETHKKIPLACMKIEFNYNATIGHNNNFNYNKYKKKRENKAPYGQTFSYILSHFK